MSRRQKYIMAQPLVPQSTAFEIERAIEKLYKKEELIKSQQNCLMNGVGQFASRPINLLILFGIRMDCLRSGRSRSLYLFIRRVLKQTVVIRDVLLCQLHIKF
jgi:hypothetical protein